MKSVIKSLLQNVNEDSLLLLQPLLQESLLSAQEQEYLTYIQDTYYQTNLVPTEEYFLTKFPEYTMSLNKADSLSLNDLKIHINQLYSKRFNLNISKQIMEIANRVSKQGLSEEDLETLRNLQSSQIQDELDTSVYDFSSYNTNYQMAKELPAGLLTGIKPIDDVIGGLTLGTVNLIAAFTSQFKSVTGLNIAYYNTFHLGYNVAVLSLEVPKQDMLHNLLCRHSVEPRFSKYPFIAHDRIRKMQLSPEEEEYLMEEILPDFQNNSKGKLFLLDESDFKSFSFSEIRAKLEKIDDICRKETGSGLDAILVDHMHLTKFSGNYKGMSDGQVINMYASFFRKLSIHFRTVDGEKQQLCSILLCQVNRDGWTRASKHGGSYSLTALSEANELERCAYRAIFLFTTDSMKEAKEMSVQLLKNRSGQLLPEPTVVYADGESYCVGDVAEGFDTQLSTDDIADLFGDSSFSIF